MTKKERELFLQQQEQFALANRYQPLPPLFSDLQRSKYIEDIPDEFRHYMGGPIFTETGMMICTNLTERVYVCGDYGLFLEARREEMVLDNLMIQKGEEYRLEPRYKNVKYLWLTAKDDSGIKIYKQLNPVKYADYVPGMFYFSPYQVYRR